MSACTYHTRRGGLLVEVVIGLALSVLFAVAVVQMTLGTFSSVNQSREQLVATNYAFEGLESVRTIARQNFDSLIDGTHGIENSNKRYVLSGSSITWDKYTLTVQIQPTYRDINGALIMPWADIDTIISEGGHEETQAKVATATVTWQSSGETKTVAAQSLLTKWYVYPLQSATATGYLIGNEYEFLPIDGGIAPKWKAIFWNAEGGISYMQVRASQSYIGLFSKDWVGSDGSTGSAYNVSGTGLHNNSAGSGRWIQAKALLTGTGTTAPIFTVLFE